MSLHVCQNPLIYNAERKSLGKLRVIRMCQYRFITGKKCTILVSDADDAEGCARVEAKGIWDISVPAPQFY